MHPGLLRQNWLCRLSETTELSMEKIHHHVLQFVHGAKNLRKQGQCWTKGRSGRPRTSEENIDRVKQAFARSSTKSIRTAAMQLEQPRSTVHKVLQKNLRLHA